VFEYKRIYVHFLCALCELPAVTSHSPVSWTMVKNNTHIDF